MTTLLQLDELSKLQQLLQEEYTPFLQIGRKVIQTFTSEQHFSICYSLTIMLREGFFKKKTERIISLFILFKLLPSEALFQFENKSQNKKDENLDQDKKKDNSIFPPFLPVLINIAQNNHKYNENQYESFFVSICLSDPNSDLFKVSPNQLDLTNIGDLEKFYPQSSQINLKDLSNKFSQIDANISLTNKIGISPSIPDPENEKSSKMATNDLLQYQLTTNEFKPSFVRPSPSLLKPFDNELIWIDYEDETLLPLWDQTISNVTTNNDQFMNLMKKAFTSQLSQPEQQQIIVILENEPKILKDSKVTSENITNLVEKNPIISFEILKLFLQDEESKSIYLHSLLNAKVTLHSMEVINKLSSGIKNLPKDFLNRYVSNCISSCSEINDKYIQSRHVRLVCAFIRSLMNNSKLDIQSMSSELQTFCLEFSRIRDASNLFRLIKNQIK
ncbi:hypothetical protein M0813_00949 [Anaeramoeba flamelloides]|uniref:CCR4-NOT transcription complex subunit 11 n=1 Tax=Anaeramoeba flamelloides TaxID=1746091 RepID=A0ABQ8X0N2_9EUKA|nr:hypothetical protein M0813_00949 [Anaeramoeba flamelloides]